MKADEAGTGAAAFTELLGPKLKTKDDDLKSTREVLGGKEAVALYFSAHWCGPCRGFTPQLVKCFDQLQASHPAASIAFVSSARDEAAFDERGAARMQLVDPRARRGGPAFGVQRCCVARVGRARVGVGRGGRGELDRRARQRADGEQAGAAAVVGVEKGGVTTMSER